jgi:hypothetical protein
VPTVEVYMHSLKRNNRSEEGGILFYLVVVRAKEDYKIAEEYLMARGFRASH